MGMEDLFAEFDLNMLYGRFNHSLDSKGRVIIPARFRSSLGDVVVITRGYDIRCLNLYSKTEWVKRMAKLKAIPASDEQGQKFIRYFLGNAEPCVPDKQGKILIPAHLREAAELEKEITLSGMGDRVEIWNRTIWEANSTYESTADIRASVEKYEF